MTCIVAWKTEDDNVVLAGDKKGSNGYTADIVKEPKVFRNKDFMIGYTSSFRMGQILKHVWTPPQRKIDQTTDNYMYCDVVNSLRKTMKDNGFLNTDNKDKSGTFIIVYENRIFLHQDEFSLLEFESKVTACGCGEDFAVASVTTLLEYEKDIDVILQKAYDLISFYSTGVSKKYDYIISE